MHSNLLGQHIRNGDATVAQAISSLASRFSGYDVALSYERALSTLAASVQRQANVLAYLDGFWLTFWVAIAGLAAVVLMKASPAGPFKPTSQRKAA